MDENPSSEPSSQIFKIMMLGDISTGKTSFLTQLIYQNAEKMPKSTTELSFFTLRLSNPSTIIQIWDTPGDQRFYYKAISILNQFNAIIIFIDVTNEHTLSRAKIIKDQLLVFSDIDVHVIESKMNIVEKMPYKRKVHRRDIEEGLEVSGSDNGKGSGSKRKGMVFEYHQEDKLEEILESIVVRYKENRNALKVVKRTVKRFLVKRIKEFHKINVFNTLMNREIKHVNVEFFDKIKNFAQNKVRNAKVKI